MVIRIGNPWLAIPYTVVFTSGAVALGGLCVSAFRDRTALKAPFEHIIVLVDKVTDHEAMKWYAERAVEHGWSRAVLTHHVATNRHMRVGAAPNNFPAMLAPVESDLAGRGRGRFDRSSVPALAGHGTTISPPGA